MKILKLSLSKVISLNKHEQVYSMFILTHKTAFYIYAPSARLRIVSFEQQTAQIIKDADISEE